MKNIKKTLATLALGLTMMTPAVSQNIRKVDISSLRESSQSKTDNLYGTKLEASKPLVGEKQNSIEGRGLNVYYQSDKDSLTDGDLSDIVKYSGMVKDSFNNISIEASADKNGSNNYNQALSMRRAESVKSAMQELYPNATIDIRALGERPGENLAERRKVKVTIDDKLSSALRSDSDYYLIDMSGSMKSPLEGTNLKRYEAVRKAEFPAGSEVYTFSGMGDVSKLEKTMPSGMTPLYNSIKELLNIAKPGSDIQILTDGGNSLKRGKKSVSTEYIINLANKKDIDLNFISVGMSQKEENIHKKIAKSTGGSYRSIR